MPLQVQDSRTGEDEDVTDRRVMAAVWGPGGPGQPATTLVMLDAQASLFSRHVASRHITQNMMLPSSAPLCSGENTKRNRRMAGQEHANGAAVERLMAEPSSV